MPTLEPVFSKIPIRMDPLTPSPYAAGKILFNTYKTGIGSSPEIGQNKSYDLVIHINAKLSAHIKKGSESTHVRTCAQTHSCSRMRAHVIAIDAAGTYSMPH